MTAHRHHWLRNTAILLGAAAAAVVYTVWADTRHEHINHPPILYPRWASSPNFVPTMYTRIGSDGYDYDRFEMELHQPAPFKVRAWDQ